MASSFKEKFKNSKFKKLKTKMLVLSNLPPRSYIDPLRVRKMNWLPVSDRVEYCVANTAFNYWNGIVPGYIHEIFKPSLCISSTGSQMTLDKPLWKKNTRQKSLSLLGPNII